MAESAESHKEYFKGEWLRESYYVWLASPRLVRPGFAAEALVPPQLRPEWRGPGAALAQYAMGCMLGAPGRALSRRVRWSQR